MSKRLPSPADVLVGKRIRVRRIECRMTQEKLGDALGVTFQQIQKYEKGANRVGSGRLNEIAGVLKVDISYFFQDAQTPGLKLEASRNLVLELLAVTGGTALAEAYLRLGAHERRIVLMVVEAMARATPLSPAEAA